MTELLSGHTWPYVIVFAVVALDGVLVVLPVRRQLQERGAYLVIAIRPIPGARTAVTFGAGMLGKPLLAGLALAPLRSAGTRVVYRWRSRFRGVSWLGLAIQAVGGTVPLPQCPKDHRRF